MTQKERMLNGMLYLSGGGELFGERQKVKAIFSRVNNDWTLTIEEKMQMLRGIVGATKTNFYIEPPVYFDYGYNLFVGENFYANFDCIFLDAAPIRIGDGVMLGPRVSIYTSGHPIDKDLRNALYEFAKPVTIGDDVWIGGGTIINPGVTIGSNVVIGSGSVVVKDIPSNVVAAGNPCVVIKAIDRHETDKWAKIFSGYEKP